ncbi:MAG: acyloxyacyl hydrolase [Bacteroidales bacterium]|nr:acyloxyacyl hydrolase [Bacteroidales bacterium]
MKSFLPLFLLVISIQSYSQDSFYSGRTRDFPGISVSYHKGDVLQTTDFVKGDNLSHRPITQHQSISLKLLWQNPGYTEWQKIFKGPYYGIGFYAGDFYNAREIGYPLSAYGVLGIPIIRGKKLELYTEFQYGVAWNWAHYDSIYNPKNLAIGGGLTVHLDIGVNAWYPLTKYLDLGAGVSFTHFSNGGFERPNRGMNLYAPFAELKYHFRGRPETRTIEKAGRADRHHGFYFMMGYGDHQRVDYELDSNYFAVGGLSAFYLYQFSNAFRAGIGTDLNYWWGLNANPDGTIGPRTLENFTVGFSAQPEVIVGKLTLLGGVGIYARHLNYGNFKQTYQRLGARFEIYNQWSLGVNVRAINFMLAEFLEFNLGYRL